MLGRNIDSHSPTRQRLFRATPRGSTTGRIGAFWAEASPVSERIVAEGRPGNAKTFVDTDAAMRTRGTALYEHSSGTATVLCRCHVEEPIVPGHVA